MGVFKINKTQDYVVMSNHHLRNKNLTLKAKGLLSQMLSLPDDWDYTLAGLAHINKESIDAVRTAVWELEKEGYIEKTRERDEKGKLGGTIYNIYEIPQKNILDPNPPKPQTEKDTKKQRETDNLNKINKNNNVNNKDKEVAKTIKKSEADQTQTTIRTETEEKTEIAENPRKTNISYASAQVKQQKSEEENKDNGREIIEKENIYEYRELIKKNIEYDWWVKNDESSLPEIEEMINIILEILNSKKAIINIAGDDYPAEFVKERFKKLTDEHIGFVLKCMKENNTKIRNIKSYLKTVLFNAPITINNYYKALVQHDLYRV